MFPRTVPSRHRGGAICRPTCVGLPLLRFLLFSISQSRASVSAELVVPRYRFMSLEPAHARHVQGLGSDPPRALSCRDLRLSLLKKANAHEVSASAFQSLATSHAFFRRPFSFLAILGDGSGCLIRTAAASSYGSEGLLLATEPPSSCLFAVDSRPTGS